ncbi:MAG TPA: hypothetical protein VJ508_06285, partial [Saprospiraceae bacterium]|nr:hypothetical protein [Saprospiraceae bacterium]
MKTLLFTCLTVLMSLGTGTYTAAQIVTSYVDARKAVVDMDQFNDPYAFSIQYQEAPNPVAEEWEMNFLRERKKEAERFTPLHTSNVPATRGTLMPPEILASFAGNNIITATPLDNHLAVSNTEQVISTINTHMLVTNINGFFVGSYKLDVFFNTVGDSPFYFDPRVIYDPQQDRFIMVLFDGPDCAHSLILIGFSQTNNPKGSWNLYAIDGCLDDDGTFADYPMLSLTDTELFLTYNEVNADSTWQAGFTGTQIHQINKMNGYNGEGLNRKVWRDIRYNGRFLRNICPVRNADESLPSSMYFISDRNFDISNDTVFLLHITGHQDDPNATLDISYRLLDQPYGFPPNAVQTRDSLATNDARILDAFLLHDRIQWVSNTMDFNSGRSAVFHGTLLTEDGSVSATGHIIAHPTDYLGYPGIAWTGSDDTQQDAIIVMSHCSPTRHPGGSAIYTDGMGNYSDIVSIIEGQRPVDMLTDHLERWGDYAGMQRFYPQPGNVWISCSYGRPGNVNEAWVAKLARPEQNVGTHDASAVAAISTYPNPTDDYVNLDIDNPVGKKLNVTLLDMSG